MESEGLDLLEVELQRLQSTYGVPMPLNLNRKVFLSHSGCDKEFVGFLYEELCSRYQDKEVAFFDEKTLPTAEPISMKNILQEAKRSQLGVLVLTEDFFVKTQNPMLELEAFISGNVRLLPLFFGMSVEEFKKKIQSRSWEDHWREWFIGRSDVEEKLKSWRCTSLRLVTTFSGLERKKFTSNHQYIKVIVDEVTKLVPPTILFSKGGVYGKKRLCKMVNNMFNKCAAKHTSSTFASSSLKEKYNGGTTLDLVGIFGFSGLGKTTISKCLCDFYFATFNGRVYYVDVGSSVMDHASSQKYLGLCRFNTSNINDFSHSQVSEKRKFSLSKQLSSMKDPVFLAIDNILPNTDSQEEASFYLGLEFPKGSKILITSKSKSILTNLVGLHSGRFSVVTEYMPALDFEEARSIFVHEFPDFDKHGCLDLEDDVNECVTMCTIHERRYHPVMLKSLAASLKFDRSISNIDWKGRLMRLRLKGITNKKKSWEKMFNLFDEAYSLLSDEGKKMFLDLALFYNATHKRCHVFQWIEKLYSHLSNEEIGTIVSELEDLCFLERKKNDIVILDLLVDFGKFKASQANEYLVRDSTNWPAYLPRRARTVSISGCGQNEMKASLSLDLRAVKDVEVLHIVDNPGLQEVWLSDIACARLRSLIVRIPEGTSVIWTICEQEWPRMQSAESGQGPRWVEIEGDVCFRLSRLSERRSIMSAPGFSALQTLQITSARDASDQLVSTLGGLWNLEVLHLSQLRSVRSIDVTTCANLKELDLSKMPSLRLISGFENSNLEKVSFEACHNVFELSIPVDSKTNIFINWCNSLKTVSCGAKPSRGNGAHSGPERGCLNIDRCPAVANIDVFSQYTGHITIDQRNYHFNEEPGDVLRLGNLLKMNAGLDYSLCRAQVERLQLTAGQCNQEMLARVKEIELVNAEHIGLFITALFKAQPKGLERLAVRCKEDDDCGCDQTAPLFGPLPMPLNQCELPVFEYHCSQVKDLASLGQWHVLESLRLSGCSSVEVWPDFAAMPSLQTLDLSFTSLKEWPASVLHLPRLRSLDMQGCQQLPAEELIKVVTFELQPGATHWRTAYMCIIFSSLASLRKDLLKGRRDGCSVANALDGVYILELVALFDRSSWPFAELVVLELVVVVMYDVWLLGEVADEVQELHIRTKMKRLLCSEGFLSFPFRAVCNQSSLSVGWRWEPVAFPGFESVISVKDLFNDLGSREPFRNVSRLVKLAMKGKMLELLAARGDSQSIDACFNASPPSDHLRDLITDFRKSSFTKRETAASCWLHDCEEGYQSFLFYLINVLLIKLSNNRIKLSSLKEQERWDCWPSKISSWLLHGEYSLQMGKFGMHTIMELIMEGQDADSLNSEQIPQYLSPQQSTYADGVPMPLNLNGAVLSSQSGRGFEFLRLLNAELLSCYKDREVGFFDKKTLPTAEAISMQNILEEARRSQLGVLVLIDDLICVQTPNPMLELEAFTSAKVRLLPLFLGMNVEEFKKKIQSC